MPKFTIPANKHGLPYGSYIMANGFPARVAGPSNKNLTFIEAFGYGHDIGDTYTHDCKVITKEEFVALAAKFGYTDTTSNMEKLRWWDQQQES